MMAVLDGDLSVATTTLMTTAIDLVVCFATKESVRQFRYFATHVTDFLSCNLYLCSNKNYSWCPTDYHASTNHSPESQRHGPRTRRGTTALTLQQNRRIRILPAYASGRHHSGNRPHARELVLVPGLRWSVVSYSQFSPYHYHQATFTLKIAYAGATTRIQFVAPSTSGDSVALAGPSVHVIQQQVWCCRQVR